MNGGRWTGSCPIPGDWEYEAKVNGWRAVVHTPTGRMFNRFGEELSIASEFATVLSEMRSLSFEWADCEALERRHKILQGSLVVFDIMDASCPLTYEERQMKLWSEICSLPSYHSLMPYLIDTKIKNRITSFAYTFDEDSEDPELVPSRAWEKLQEMNRILGCDFYEGLVAKRRHSLYPVTRKATEETTAWIKFRWNNAPRLTS
jgi:hypothetical protein